MKIDIQECFCIVTREPGDLKHYENRNATGESRLLLHTKRELNKRGINLIKKGIKTTP